MNREDIIRMAREAGSYPAAPVDRALLLFSESHLERFAALVAAARDKEWIGRCNVEVYDAITLEREACAKVCESLPLEWEDQPNIAQAELATMMDCALAIRARGQA